MWSEVEAEEGRTRVRLSYGREEQEMSLAETVGSG